MTMHPLPASVAHVAPPPRFTFPFCYEPHPLCVAAAGEVRRYLSTRSGWHGELERGKMFGVLVASGPEGMGFLAAFSGTLDGRTRHDYFVPPVFDLMGPEGLYFQSGQAGISAINRRIDELRAAIHPSALRAERDAALDEYRRQMAEDKARRDNLRATLAPDELARIEPSLVRESQHAKAQLVRLRREWDARIRDDEAAMRGMEAEAAALQEERRRRSAALQEWLFAQFAFLNARGESRTLGSIFGHAVPPSGAGECCAPRLLQEAYRSGLRPLCMAEFWVGGAPDGELRQDGRYYPSCSSRCKPILGHMLGGLDVDPDPMAGMPQRGLRVLYSDADMAVVAKPHGMLSVPGRDSSLPSVMTEVRRLFPMAEGPLIVHRLDQDTAGLMAVALNGAAYRAMQDDFLHRRVGKTYRALLERPMEEGLEGTVDLPMRPDITDRPRQTVDFRHGRTALSHYRVIGNPGGHALVELQPLTGRTHQLRVHCAHPSGLDNPIVGDRLYGSPADRLHLLACTLTLRGMTFRIGDDDIADI